MLQCILCGQSPRQDDPTHTIYASGKGTVQCCTPCADREMGRDPVPARVYPVDGPKPPTKPGSDGFIDVCGICRTALRWDERPQLMRVHEDDLSEHRWQEYEAHLKDARHMLQQTVTEARQAFEQATAPQRQERDRAIAEINQDLQQSIDQLVLTCTHPLQIEHQEALLRERHAEALAAIQAEYEQAIKPAKQEMDESLQMAGFQHRRALVAAWADIPPEPADLQPGAYAVGHCCLARYRPRILDRLKRQGIVAAHLTEDQMTEGMLA